MTNKAKVTILGCGGSAGVPSVGNYWGACDPNEPRNRRTRSSIAVQTANTTLVIDSGPDFRNQLNREEITHIDAMLYTHMHGDHVNGIEDVRMLAFRNKIKMPVYASAETLEDLERRFNHLFKGGASEKYYPPILDSHICQKEERIGDIPFTTFAQDHGTCNSTGYRFGNFGYSVDIYTLDSEAIEALRGVEIWAVDAAGYKQTDNSVHANLEEIYRLNKQIGAQKIILSSLTLGMDYQTVLNETPEKYIPAYDGMDFEITL